AGALALAWYLLGRVTADVYHHRSILDLAPRGHPAEHHQSLVVTGEQPGCKAVAPFDLPEESFPVVCVAHRAGRDCERVLRTERFERAPEIGEDIADAGDRDRQQASPLVHALA